MSILDSNFHLSEFWINKNIYEENSPKNVFYRLRHAYAFTSRNLENGMTISRPVPCYIPCWEGKYFSGNLMIFTDVQLILIIKRICFGKYTGVKPLPAVRKLTRHVNTFWKQLIQLTVEDNYLGQFMVS